MNQLRFCSFNLISRCSCHNLIPRLFPLVDERHSKDLFGSANCNILNNMQGLYGNVLGLDNALPHLICRPCERRLDNPAKFKNLIEETQKSLESEFRSKHVLDTSPSVAQPSKTKSRVCASTSSEGFSITVSEKKSSIHRIIPPSM